MNKGDKVLVKQSAEEDWLNGIYDHEFEGRHFARLVYPDGYQTNTSEYNLCKPHNQTVEDWTHEWWCNRSEGLFKTETFLDYYEDRKKWEETK